MTINYENYLRINFAEDFFNKNVDSENASKSVSRVYIFYDNLAYSKSIETVTSGSMLDLMANVGGIMGLFLGVSVLSLFETFEVLIEICFIFYNRYSNKKMIASTSRQR